MNATRQLHDLGQSLWLDNITRGILNDGPCATRHDSPVSFTRTGAYDDDALPLLRVRIAKPRPHGDG